MKLEDCIDFAVFKYFSFACSLFFLLIIISIFILQLDEVVIADGIIRPDSVETVVKTLNSGKVDNVFYKNTQFINKDDVLFIQDCKYEKDYLENLKILRSVYENNIKAYTELKNLLETTTIDYCFIDETLLKTNSIYSSFINQYKNYKTEINAKKKYLERNQMLYPGIISKQDLENLENEYSQTKLNFIRWIEDKKIEVYEKLAEYFQKIDECNFNISQSERIIETSVVTANQTGYINEVLRVSCGDYLKEGTVILSIIPDNEKLKAKINISNLNISKLQVGQEVLFQIKDLPYTKYGKLKGKITLIPRDAIFSDEVYFPVEVDLEQNYLQSNNKFGMHERINLKIGTKLFAKVIVDKNTLFQKFLQKVIIYEK